MLRKHQFEYLLGGEFGHLGDQATSFRKIVEASILATDMSRHFEFVQELSEMGKSFTEKGRDTKRDVEADRLLLCAGLIKSADISNPVSLLSSPPQLFFVLTSYPLSRVDLIVFLEHGLLLSSTSGRFKPR